MRRIAWAGVACAGLIGTIGCRAAVEQATLGAFRSADPPQVASLVRSLPSARVAARRTKAEAGALAAAPVMMGLAGNTAPRKTPPGPVKSQPWRSLEPTGRLVRVITPREMSPLPAIAANRADAGRRQTVALATPATAPRAAGVSLRRLPELPHGTSQELPQLSVGLPQAPIVVYPRTDE